MRLKEYKLDGAKAILYFDNGEILLEAKGKGVVRCVYYRGAMKNASPLGIISTEKTTGGWTASGNQEALTFCCDGCTVQVDRKNGRFIWLDGEGKLLLQEGGKELEPFMVMKYSTGGKPPVVRRVKTVDGERNFVENLTRHEDREAYHAKLFFRWQADEEIHGLGQAEEGIYNYRGHCQYLYQHNMRIPIPVIVSDKRYGILFDCGSLMTFQDNEDGSYLYLDTVEQLDYYFIAAEELDGIVSGLRSLTGRAAMLPKWAFGYVQSKEAYQTQKELVDTVEEYRRRRIPLDCIVQDWNTWFPGLWGDKHPDKSRYPALGEAIRRIHERNVHTMVSIWPNMNIGGADYEEFLQTGHLLGDSSTYDAFSEEAREIYWKQAESELFQAGFDSWWCDSTEPFSGPDWCGNYLREPRERFELVGNEHKKFLDPGLANLFALEHARGIYENQRAAAPEKRVLNLTRSGYAGSQKYGTVLWSGDISATWEVLRKQITEGLNFAMSGMPYWTMDAGGFFVVKDQWEKRGCGCHTNPDRLWFWHGDYNDGVDDLGYRELYVRWLQLAVFLPMFRSHGTDTPREIWNFGEPGGPFYSAIEQAIHLRYQLMPYVYSLAAQVVLDHGTMMRSLLFDFASDPIARQINDEFMFGNSILVCPVTEPMYYEADSKRIVRSLIRTCYLPEGVNWVEFWTGKAYMGGQTVAIDAPLDKIPLFIRAGSIIPMEQGLEYACEEKGKPMEILVYPGADGEFLFYEDAGDGYGYEKEEYNRIRMAWEDKSECLRIGSAEFDFPQTILGRACVLRAGTKSKEFLYRGKPMIISL